jgi:hypothetical protein
LWFFFLSGPTWWGAPNAADGRFSAAFSARQ